MLVCWGEPGMPVFWGCKWDLSIPTKSQARESSEECTGNALAQNSSHIIPAWYQRLSCKSRKPQLLGEAGCNWGSSEGCSFFLSHGVTGASQLLTRLGDTAPILSYPEAQSYPSKSSSFPSPATWHIFGFILLLLPSCHCICYFLLIYELL